MSISNYKQILSQLKRKQRGSSSSGSEADTQKDSSTPVRKKNNFDSSSEMDPQPSFVNDINKRLDSLQQTLASKQDIENMKADFKKEIENFTSAFSKRINTLEGRVAQSEGETGKLKEEVTVLKKTNADLFKKLNMQNKQVTTLNKSLNDLEQQGRKWNVRVFNIPETNSQKPETTADCVKKCCDIFTNLVGVKVSEPDIEIAHRIGNKPSPQSKSRPVIIRFLSRKKKDEVLSKRRNLKGNPGRVAVGEDLTYLNYRLLKDAKQHSATMDAWSSNGKVIAKLKNGKTLKLDIGCDVDATLRQEM
eukprot:TRINITY_DN19706_c0_g1_i16.p1 TRINITY_DN19706_c0_g1~~TRINITY_DN19706_c0_g1_i16.p1  ORF type:complete len:305 (+),score=50.15 TRINITY_DN19706_c0_g1_i16:138-1052(+)